MVLLQTVVSQLMGLQEAQADLAEELAVKEMLALMEVATAAMEEAQAEALAKVEQQESLLKRGVHCTPEEEEAREIKEALQEALEEEGIVVFRGIKVIQDK